MASDRGAPAAAPSSQTLAGAAALLEIGASLDIVDALLADGGVRVADVARRSGVAEGFVADYYAALAHAGLATAAADPARYDATPLLATTVRDVGYILWATRSCAPLLANAAAFSRNRGAASAAFPRDGAHVARTSRWIGEQDFYAQSEEAILARRPARVVDLGSGTCALLVRCARQCPDLTGVGIDVSADACHAAAARIAETGLQARLSVIERAIESLVEDPSPLVGADVIHGSFVFHDLVADDGDVLDDLFGTFRRVAPAAAVMVVDAVPYAAETSERSFSAAFTFLHSHFMGRRLLSESEWRDRLSRAGYRRVDVSRLAISGGRAIVASSR